MKSNSESAASEASVQSALRHLEQFPGAKVAAIARLYGVKRSLLRSRIAGHKTRQGRAPTYTRLTDAEEQAICRYIDRLDAVNLAVHHAFVSDAANAILKARAPKNQQANPPTVGIHWTTRFLRRYGYTTAVQRALEADRQASESLQSVEEYFRKLWVVLQERGIEAKNLYNMDETGFRIGVGKDQLVITRRKRRQYLAMPENRESATSIECISADGTVIPACLILTAEVHMARWYQQDELDPATLIAVSESGYSNDRIALHWLEHFNRHTEEKAQGALRLLIIDGHGSHHTKQFIEYCDNHGIIAFGMPPHMTHLLQPLDVVVFQPLKHYHAQALDILVRDGLTNITKIEFLGLIEGIRERAFKEATILSAFRKTGIWPWDPEQVLQGLRERLPQYTPSPPSTAAAPASSSPFNTPVTLRQMHKVADKLEAVIFDGGIDPETSAILARFIKGSMTTATELIQTKRDLGRTRYAEDVARRRRAGKNTRLQSGGVLTVQEARSMLEVRQQDEDAKVQAKYEALMAKRERARRQVAEDAAKQARAWRNTGRLGRAEIYEDGMPMRLLKRF